jgi:hypothetical protein
VSSGGYSGTPLARKLGIAPGRRVLLVGAPPGFEADALGALPDGVDVVRGDAAGEGLADVIVAFCAERARLERLVPALRAHMRPAAGLWIAWPKRASKVPSDVTEEVVREIALRERLVDNKVCAIDATWSGLRLVIRLADRPR